MTTDGTNIEHTKILQALYL